MRYIDRLKRSTKTTASPLVPILRPWDWELDTQCYSESLMRFRPAREVPRVAFGRARGDGFDMLRHGAMASLGMSYEELLAYASENLAATPTDWEIVHTHEETGNAQILGLPDEGSLTASRIFDRDLMQRAHDRLGARVLFVGVPTLHELYVCDGSPMADRALHAAFVRWIKLQKAASIDVDPLSAKAFVLRDGQVMGTYEPPGDGG